MTSPRRERLSLAGATAALAALFSMTTAGCGIYGDGGGGGGPTANIAGDILAVLPEDSEREIVVFAYQLGNTENEDCTQPELPDFNTPFKFDILDPGETEFQVPNSKIGRLVIVFLLDNPGRDADQQIDPGDPVAVLDDPECVLDDVPRNYIVFIENTRINFTGGDQVGYPAPGRADAEIFEEPLD